jgi:Icc protein
MHSRRDATPSGHNARMTLELVNGLRTVHSFRYVEARRRRDGGGVHERTVEVEIGTAIGLPTGVDGILFASDLQGCLGGNGPLAGVAIVEDLTCLALDGVLPPLSRLGCVLAGDLFGDPTAGRSANGDVSTVWDSFADEFAWVAGVLGNHDELGDLRDLASDGRRRFNERRTNVRVLDGDHVIYGGVRIAGVSGIAGRQGKPMRRPEDDQLRALRSALTCAPDILVLHQGPDLASLGYEGSPAIAAVVREHRVPLVVSGHQQWPAPTAMLSSTTRVLNVDGRVVILLRG